MDGLYAGITNDDSGCISASCSVWPGSVATSPHSFRVQSLILSLGYYKTFAAGFLRLSKKKMPVGGLSMQNCECVCVWLTKLSFPGGRGGQWRWWPQWCFCSVLAGLHFTLYHCCWTMVTHTHTHSPNILLLSYLWSSESMRVVSHPGVRVVFYFRSDTCWGQFLQSLHDLNIIMFFF